MNINYHGRNLIILVRETSEIFKKSKKKKKRKERKKGREGERNIEKSRFKH